MVPNNYLIPPLPPELERLGEAALDLRWSWSHVGDPLWKRIDPSLWERTHNPWIILQTVSNTRLDELAKDRAFLDLMEQHLARHRRKSEAPTWFSQAHPGSDLSVAYLSMEFGLSEALPIYSGGLGILAGDHLKTSSDLGVPLIAIGLLFQRGYFHQAIDADGRQIELYPYNDPSMLPLLPVREASGEWLRVDVNFPGRRVRLRAWEATVGRIRLYLLDSNDPENSPSDRCITAELYTGVPELRLQQEIALGIGGWRLLELLGLKPAVCHLNEGHAALAVIERARSFMVESGQGFDVALAATRAGNIFTTHTAVDAAFDRFAPCLVSQYLRIYAEALGIGVEALLALGRRDPADPDEPLNMAFLAVRGSAYVNGVSRLHGAVSRRLFQPLFPRWPLAETPITHITNGVHMASWDSAPADAVWTEACGQDRWLGDISTLEADFKAVPDEKLWAFRNEARRRLVLYVRERLARQLEASGADAPKIAAAATTFRPEVLTIGFARRFATYKRPALLLHDPQRLAALLQNPQRPLQLIVAGKAHPQDGRAKGLIKAWSDFIRNPGMEDRVVFLADYDIDLAQSMVQGVDVWLNTPCRPMEASGTSGMKVLVNGGLNLSSLDGWWAEAYGPGAGWAIGDEQDCGNDPGREAADADQLYRILENEIVPAFYERDQRQIPPAWVSRIRTSMAELTPRFSTNRMVVEYVQRLYLPAAGEYTRRTRNGAGTGMAIGKWLDALRARWEGVRFGALTVKSEGRRHGFAAEVFLNGIDPNAVRVELYAEGPDGGPPERIEMQRESGSPALPGADIYLCVVDSPRPPGDFTPRVIPQFDGVAVPKEAGWIVWQR